VGLEGKERYSTGKGGDLKWVYVGDIPKIVRYVYFATIGLATSG